MLNNNGYGHGTIKDRSGIKNLPWYRRFFLNITFLPLHSPEWSLYGHGPRNWSTFHFLRRGRAFPRMRAPGWSWKIQPANERILILTRENNQATGGFQQYPTGCK